MTKMKTIPRSEYEQIQQEIAELRKLLPIVEELNVSIALLKEGKKSGDQVGKKIHR